MRLNDKIRIDNSWWNINRVIDYNANVKGFTKVELISIDTEIDLPPFNYRIPKLPTDAQISRATKEIINTSNSNNNVVMLGGDVTIKGRNNVVLGATRGMIVGDDNVVSDEYVDINDTLSSSGNFATNDLTFTGNRTHDLDGNTLFINDSSQSFLFMGSGQTQIGYNDSSVQVVDDDVNVFINSVNTFSVSVGNNIECKDVLRIKKGIGYSVTTQASNYTVSVDDTVIHCTSGTFTVTLPTLSSASTHMFIIKNSGTGVITVDGDGTETIDGALNQTLSQYDSITVLATTTDWIII
jgi:hypothetical protein